MSKTVQCAICGQSVGKRQTLSIGDGKRACRSHEGTGEQAEKAQSKLESQYEEGRRPKITPFRSERNGELNLKPRCILCHNEGMLASEFFKRLLVEQEKYRMRTGKLVNPFNPAELHESKGELKNVRCLFYVTHEQILKAGIKLLYDEKQILELLGVVLVCADCKREKGIENIERKEIDLKTLFMLGEMMKKPIKDIATNELEQEKKHGL